MEAGRQRNNDTKMKGCLNLENKLTDTYLPRKCDFTDRVVTSKDHSSIQLSICDVNPDGTINLGKVMLLSKKCSMRRSSSDCCEMFNSAIFINSWRIIII